MGKIKIFVLLLTTLLVSQTCYAKPLRVGVAGSAPFVENKGKIIDGVSVQVFEAVGDIEKFEYTLIHYNSVTDALADVKNNKIDLAIGPISITAKRAEEVDFTQPYYRSDLGILTHSVEKSMFQRARPFLSRAFLIGVLFLLALLTIVGALVWLTEKKSNSEEFPSGARGLFNGMWFAIVTMTTVGYGDKCPKSLPGRLVTAAWMIVATVSYSTLTAGIATALTLSSLDHAAIVNPEDMHGQRVGVVRGTTGASAAQHFGATTIGCKSLEEAAQFLLEDKVEAVVFDLPALRYYVQKNPDDKYILAKATFESQNYGFALPIGSEHLHEINVALLALHENDQIHEIAERWMSGGGSGNSD
jgi:polar amino acid transport system substrate-binding protein